jgi:hypothetical protein
MKTEEKIIDTLLLKNGFDIDLDEGWRKLTSSQFGGSPGRAFSELIQNAIDSYPIGTPWKKRKGAITTTMNTISITDWGEGLDTKRLSLIAMAGGTDKFDNSDKIGRFGLGFISVFNPHLCTRRVELITRCEGHTVELVFTVNDPEKRPTITVQLLKKKINFSTCITLVFSKDHSVNDCLEFAKKSLTYYPCPMTIDGVLFKSEWQKDLTGVNIAFSVNNCDGIIRKGSKWNNVRILCKYEFVMESSLSHFITGGYNTKYSIEEYEMNNTPYIPDVDILMNINNLQLVISRDNYYLDCNYRDAKATLNQKLRHFLYLDLMDSPNPQVVIANQYIFRKELSDIILNPGYRIYDREETKLIKLLAEIPVYRINGRPGLFSLVKLKNMLHPGLPFYYSPKQSNLRWLGGSFKHDYIVIPDSFTQISGRPLLYDRLFETIFKDVVNLDTITSDSSKIQNLVMRNIVSKSALSPNCQILGIKDLSEKHRNTIDELSRILADVNIKDIISNNLQIPVDSIKPVFFTINEEGAYLSTGLFDELGKPISNDFASNILEKSDDKISNILKKKKIDLFLGLNLDHPFINYLLECTSPHKEYYTLTYLAHELALCQKMLIPYSPFYHLVKEKLAQDMRKVLTKNLLNRAKN